MNIIYINERKRALGLTNAKISEMTGITLSTLDKITSGANGNPKLNTLIALANALHCTIDAFLEQSNPEHYSQEESQFISDFRSLDERGKSIMMEILAYAAEMNRQGVAERHRLDPTQADFETRAVRSEAEVRLNAAIE